VKAILHNPNAAPVTEWVYCGMPPGAPMPASGVVVVTGADGVSFKSRWFQWGRGLVFKVAALPPGAGIVEINDDVIVGGPGWQQHPHLNLLDLLPTWVIERGDPMNESESLPVDRWIGRSEPSGSRFVRVAAECPAAILFHVRSSTIDVGDDVDDNWTHELFVTAWSDQPFVDFVSCSVRGMVGDRAGQLLDLPDAIRLRTHGPMVGIVCRMPERYATGSLRIYRNPRPSFPAAKHNRALRFVARGRMQNLLPADHIIRDGELPAARQLPVRCVLSTTDWSGRWLAGQQLPAVPQDANQEHVEALRIQDAVQNAAPLDYFAARPHVQPIESWTTGEQPGFGASACGRVVSMQAPELLPLLEYSAESYCYRPTANREEDGSPVLAANHAGARTQSHRPDNSWSEADRNDRWGWPFPPVWPVGPTTSDDQHRDAATLHAACVLLNCPVLESVVFDHVEMTKLDAQLSLGWCPSARAVGRLFLDYAGQTWLGHDVSWAAARLFKLALATRWHYAPAPPHSLDVVVCGPIETAKYGWIDNRDGRQPWQQSIVAIGARALALAADLAPRDSVLRYLAGDLNKLAIDLARGVLATAWFRPNVLAGTPNFVHVYAFADWEGMPDAAWPPPLVKLDGTTNERVYIDGACEPWDAACAELLQFDDYPLADPFGQNLTCGERARAILAQLGPCASWRDSHWRAVRPFSKEELGQ